MWLFMNELINPTNIWNRYEEKMNTKKKLKFDFSLKCMCRNAITKIVHNERSAIKLFLTSVSLQH